MKRRVLAFPLITMLAAFAGPFSQAAISPETNALVFSAKIEPPSPTPHGHFGEQVAALSNLIVFGNAINAESTNNILANVFRRIGRTITHEGVLPGPAITNLAVTDIATDGERIFVAALEDRISKIYIFTRAENGWIRAPTLQPSERIGRNIAISGDVLAAGGTRKVLLFEHNAVNGANRASLHRSE